MNVSEDVPEEDPSNIESNIIMEEGKELCGTSENSRSSELLSELHEKGSDDSEKIKVGNALLLYIFSLKLFLPACLNV